MPPKTTAIICANCHYLEKHSTTNSNHIEVGASDRKKLHNKTYPWDESVIFKCRMGVWKETHKPSNTTILSTPRDINRDDSCKFHLYHPKLVRPEIITGRATDSDIEVDAQTGIVYTLKYTGRTLLIEGLFIDKKGRKRRNQRVLARPNFDSENENVISFLVENPDKFFTRDALQKALSKSEGSEVFIKKPFRKIAEHLGFKGNLLKLFFKSGKTGVCLHTKITRKDLDELGIKFLPIN